MKKRAAKKDKSAKSKKNKNQKGNKVDKPKSPKSPLRVGKKRSSSIKKIDGSPKSPNSFRLLKMQTNNSPSGQQEGLALAGGLLSNIGLSGEQLKLSSMANIFNEAMIKQLEDPLRPS